jgi:hypothetical protein
METAVLEDNSHAGQGAVMLDIGGDIGALVVTMPAAMAGIEVEIRPAGISDFPAGHHHTHVGVVGRPVGEELVYSAVYSELESGTYELHELPNGPVRLTASVQGGSVTEVNWPTLTA